MTFRLELRGVTELRAELAAYRDQLDNMDELWTRIGWTMARRESEWFDSDGEGSWPQLAEETVRYKQSRGLANAEVTLERSELLRDSLTEPLVAMDISQGRSTLGTFTRKVMTWGTDANELEEFAILGWRNPRDREYAHFHQHTDPVTGEPTSYGLNPPERQVIPDPMPMAWLEDFRQDAEDWIEQALRESGLKE